MYQLEGLIQLLKADWDRNDVDVALKALRAGNGSGKLSAARFAHWWTAQAVNVWAFRQRKQFADECELRGIPELADSARHWEWSKWTSGAGARSSLGGARNQEDSYQGFLAHRCQRELEDMWNIFIRPLNSAAKGAGSHGLGKLDEPRVSAAFKAATHIL